MSHDLSRGARKKYSVALFACIAPFALQAQEISGVADVMTNQLGALTRTKPRGTLEPVKVYFRGGALRLQFRDAAGNSYALVRPDGSSAGWLVDESGMALVIPRVPWSIRFDPDHPCDAQGMFSDCQQAGNGLRGDRNAKQWRYRFENPTGPGATRQGRMWLDAETGLVLGYEGGNGLGPNQRWEVRTVHYEPVPDTLFEKPASRAKR